MSAPEGVHGAEIGVVDVEITAGPTEDEMIAKVVAAFTAAAEAVGALPDGRQKSLALTHLEDAFTRAVFASMRLEGLNLPNRG